MLASSPLRWCWLQVPKMLGSLRHVWAPEAFLVSFKLETDEKLLISKVTSCTIHLHPLSRIYILWHQPISISMWELQAATWVGVPIQQQAPYIPCRGSFNTHRRTVLRQD